jgi:hypothetical protein
MPWPFHFILNQSFHIRTNNYNKTKCNTKKQHVIWSIPLKYNNAKNYCKTNNERQCCHIKILKRPSNTFLIFLTAIGTIVLPIPCQRVNESLDHNAETNESILTSFSLQPFFLIQGQDQNLLELHLLQLY